MKHNRKSVSRLRQLLADEAILVEADRRQHVLLSQLVHQRDGVLHRRVQLESKIKMREHAKRGERSLTLTRSLVVPY